MNHGLRPLKKPSKFRSGVRGGDGLAHAAGDDDPRRDIAASRIMREGKQERDRQDRDQGDQLADRRRSHVVGIAHQADAVLGHEDGEEPEDGRQRGDHGQAVGAAERIKDAGESRMFRSLSEAGKIPPAIGRADFSLDEARARRRDVGRLAPAFLLANRPVPC